MVGVVGWAGRVGWAGLDRGRCTMATLDKFTIMTRSYESAWVQCECGTEIAHGSEREDLDLSTVVKIASQHTCPARKDS